LPTDTSYVGPHLLPIPTAGNNSPIVDPIAAGLLDFFGYITKAAADSKLAEMGGPSSSAAITDALPAANRFGWNHNGSFMRPHPSSSTTVAPLPGAWCWCASTVPNRELSTLVRDALEHEYHIQYIYPQVQIPDGYEARSGLMRAIADQAARYFGPRRTRHPSYGYGADADGTPLFRSLNLLLIEFVRATPGQMLAQTPTNSAQGSMGRSGSEGHVQRFFPAVEIVLKVVAPVDNRQPIEPDDILNDTTVDISVGDNTASDAVPFVDAVLIAPRDLP
jgi:hypothetical protein